jgi:hypothetical protein
MGRVWGALGDVRPPLVAAGEDTLAAVEKAMGAISAP